MTPQIAIVNQSTRLTQSEIDRMAAAVAHQCARDVAPIYGVTPALRWGAGVKQDAESMPCYIMDTPDTDGALGYHDEDENGVPYIKVFTGPTLDNGGTALEGPNSVSVTLSHEILELIGDAAANLWADGPDGHDYARELCDAVEGDSYEIDGVSVSNFVYPAFFDPKAAPRSVFDYMGKLRAPFAMTEGGYQIQRTEPGKIGQIFAKHGRCMHVAQGLVLVMATGFPEWKRKFKLRKAARRARK